MKIRTKEQKTAFNQGARAVLSLVIRRARSRRYGSPAWLKWALDSDERYQKKPGGIGRR